MIIEIDGKRPRIGSHVFIAPNAMVIGDVEIKDSASIWYGAVLRGDLDPIIVGKNSNIQDNCTVHTDTGYPVTIGDRVTVGHNTVIHGCRIEDDCLIGMGSCIQNGAQILRGSIVAAGSVVRQMQEVGPEQLAAGVPTKIKREIPEQEVLENRDHAETYALLARTHEKIHER